MGLRMRIREFDEKILSELEQAGYIRRKDLLEVLKTKYAKEKGFSTTSLNRRIGELISAGKIGVIEPAEFAEYGISDEDKRAKYLISGPYADKKRVVDGLIVKSSTGDQFEKRLALKEIKRNLAEYSLNPVQLSHLSTCLGADEDTDKLVIEILHEALLKQRSCIGEEERASLIGDIRQALGAYTLPPVNTSKNLLLEILGFFSDEFVVEMLKVDLERVEGEKELLSKEDDEVRKKTWIKTVYHSKYLIHAFEENIDSLIEQMWKYNEMGKKEGHLDERKIALIIDDLLDYIAENRDKAVYYEKMCGARK